MHREGLKGNGGIHINPLTAGADYLRFIIFLLTLFGHVTDKN